MFSTICLILSIIIWLTYIIYIYIKYKPDCISRSYYLIKDKNIFTAWIIIISFLVFPAWVEISPVAFQFLPFLSVIALSIVGLCPKYLESDRTAHILASSVTCILSLIWNIVTGLYIVPLVLGIILVIIYFSSINDKFYWTECLAFLNIYLSIIFS